MEFSVLDNLGFFPLMCHAWDAESIPGVGQVCWVTPAISLDSAKSCLQAGPSAMIDGGPKMGCGSQLSLRRSQSQKQYQALASYRLIYLFVLILSSCLDPFGCWYDVKSKDGVVW